MLGQHVIVDAGLEGANNLDGIAMVERDLGSLALSAGELVSEQNNKHKQHEYSKVATVETPVAILKTNLIGVKPRLARRRATKKSKKRLNKSKKHQKKRSRK
jgi:hypothetical protein